MGFYSTYEELKLIDAAFCSIARLKFLQYLWGIETSKEVFKWKDF